MRFLFFNEYNVTPHLETELEIAYNLKAGGGEIFVVICRGELQTCYGNPSHLPQYCRLCISSRKIGFERIGLPKENFIFFDQPSVLQYSFPVFQSISDLKSFTYNGIDIGMGVASSLISELRDHNFNLETHKKKVFKGLETSLFALHSFESIIHKIKPDAVYLFNGRFLEQRPLMRLCERAHIDFFVHERGGTKSSYLLRKNQTPHSILRTSEEMLELWGGDGVTKRLEGARFFIERRNKVQQSWYVFTEKQIVGHLPSRFNPQLRNIAIFNSSMDEYEGIDEFSDNVFLDDNKAIEWLVSEFARLPEFHFYLRVHPNLARLTNTQTKEIGQLKLLYQNLTVIEPEDVIDSYALMDACEKIIVFNSTIGAEAVFWNKPVVLIGHALYESLNGFYKAGNKAEIRDLIFAKLAAFPNDDILKYGYWELHKGLSHNIYKADTLTSGRFLGKPIKPARIVVVINFLEHYINRTIQLLSKIVTFLRRWLVQQPLTKTFYSR